MVLIWDMLVFLGCTQLYLGLRFLKNRQDQNYQSFNNKLTFYFFSAFVVTFWLVWGGYSVDAWRYLSRFDFSPLHFHEEQLFWISGYVLNKIVSDPWPIKIISASTVLLLSIAYFKHLGKYYNNELTLSFMLLLITPGFFLLSGNAVRQGLSGSFEVLGTVFFLQQRYWLWILLATIGFFVHQFGALLVVAIVVAKFLKKYLFFCWLASFLVSPASAFIFSIYGYDLEGILRYGDYSEGIFHWEKVIVSGLLSIFVFASFRFQPSLTLDFRHIYLALVTISNTVIIYEVPFERVFIFSDLIAPIAIAQILARSSWVKVRYQVLMFLILCGSILLWTNPSIVKALGYI